MESEALQPNPDLLNLTRSLQARFSLIYIPTREEDRLVRWLHSRRTSFGGPREVKVWSITSGLVGYDPEKAAVADSETMAPGRALEKVWQDVSRLGDSAMDGAGALYVFRDLHPHFKDRSVVRWLRDLARDLRGTLSTVILVSPTLEVPSDLEMDIEVCDFPLPSREALGQSIYDKIVLEHKEDGLGVDDSPDLRHAVLRAASGLTQVEADNALSKAVAECGGLNAGVVDVVNREKKRFVRRTAGLDFVATGEIDMDGVGGLDVAKRWFDERLMGMSPEATAFGLEAPKGVTMLGLPGTGKSLTARALAHQWHLPLLRLDLSALKSSDHGKSEGNLQAALKVAGSIAPCVLWLDEIEKAFAGAGASWVGDSGVAKGMFGMFLTWMQEQKGVFVYATANDVTALPPELLRKGRLDEVFFVHFPTLDERMKILGIHLEKRGRKPSDYDLRAVAEATVLYVGAELEQIVKDGLYRAYHDKLRGAVDDLTTQHLLDVARRMVPLSRTMGDQLRPLLTFVEEGRAVRASALRDEVNEAAILRMFDDQAAQPAPALAGTQGGF